jgi:Cu(I)/Ag(I) efflux system membrane fusion protein
MRHQAWILVGLAAFSGFVGCGGQCQTAHDHSGHAQGSAMATAAAASALAPRPSTGSAADPHAGHKPSPPASTSPAGSVDPHAGHGAPGADVPGYAHVPLEGLPLPELGLDTVTVEDRPLVRHVRTSGWVTVNETLTSHVHAKVRGYVVSSHKSFVGATVKRGDPLVSLYSEGVLAAELELLTLVDQGNAMEAALPGSAASKSMDAVVDATRKRFALWDISPAQVARVERTGKPSRGVTLSAPRDGVILARGALDGAYVEPSTELFVVSDVSKLWVVFDVFEADMPYVKLGQTVTLRCEGMTAPHTSTVTFVAPAIDPSTRSLRARVEVDNQGGMLRPGAFSTVELELPVESGLVVPEESVIRTGVRDMVFVVDGGMLVPTAVVLGPKAEGFYRVESGLTQGAVVARGAAFLIDAESQLRGAGTSGGHAHGGH